MGKRQRIKGKRGEREVVHILKRYGVEATRYAPMQASGYPEPDVKAVFPGGKEVHIEVKRRADLPDYIKHFVYLNNHKHRATFIREDYGEWMVILPLDFFLELMGVKDDDA